MASSLTVTPHFTNPCTLGINMNYICITELSEFLTSSEIEELAQREGIING